MSTIRAIEHVQLAIPEGGEPRARAFYAGALGLAEVPKPPELAKRGGAWFEQGGVKVHLGVEKDFRAARKAHVALLVDNVGALAERCRSLGCETDDSDPLEGFVRVYVYDPFGNRLELMERREHHA